MAKIFTPVRLRGVVTHGFGRGSKELGIPTANMDKTAVCSVASLSTGNNPALKNGVYYGFASVSGGPVFKAVTSVGWNPQYMNKEKSVEVHILHNFKDDFYGEELRFIFLGYIRDECAFTSVEALIERIHKDIEEGSNSLETMLEFRDDEFFR